MNCKKALKKLNYCPKDKKPLQEGEKHKLVEYSTMSWTLPEKHNKAECGLCILDLF